MGRIMTPEQNLEGWDEAARKNAVYYIGTVDAQTIDEFFNKGALKAEELTRGFLKAMNFDPAGKRMLDIGCGIGEMTRFFSDIFGQAYGVDFSGEMIKRANELNKDKPNLFFKANNGVDLSIYEDDLFDFCFSYAVFEHVPRLEIIASYIREIDRVLKPGGLFKFQARGSRWVRVFKIIPIHRSLRNFLNSKDIGLEKLYILLTTRDHILPKARRGYYVSRRDLEGILQNTDLGEVTITGENTHFMWCSGRKKS